jgi:riboflavin-specific deaminase-like protein
LLFIHRVRDLHDAVLIGVSTLLADDPRLAPGPRGGGGARSVILDTRLRTPLAARLLSSGGPRPLIVYAEDPCGRARGLEEAGADLIRVAGGAQGVDLGGTLSALHEKGIHSLVAEGGAKVLASFLRQDLADSILVTIAPLVFGGYPALAEGSIGGAMRSMAETANAPSGRDLLVFGEIEP